jgi:cysteine-rich repeat protein
VLIDPPPRPSGGSGVVVGPVGDPIWVELDDIVVGGAVPPLVSSHAALSIDPPPEPATPSPTIAFNGVINSPTTGTPPDAHIAVGPGLTTAGRVMMVTNGHLQIWDKTGATVAGPTLLDTVFNANCFDPKVLYDQHAGRFFMVALQGSSSALSNIHIAVSDDGTPDNLTTDWTFLSGSAVSIIGGVATWADYPSIGADSGSLFITTNQFDDADFSIGLKIRVFDKAALLGGTYTFNDVDFESTLASPATTTQPAHVYGVTDSGGFYLISRIGSTTFRIFHVSGAPAAPVVASGFFTWAAGTFPADRGADQCTVSNPDLDTLSSRVMNALYRDGKIWLCLTSDPDDDGETEVVWQVINTNGGPPTAPTVADSGFIDGTGTNPWTYMPSINVNEAGDAAIGYTQSSATECPGVWYVSRLSTDPPGTFGAPVQARAGPGFYDSFSTPNPDRWGDYSATVVDPTDDCFWVANEFAWSSATANSEWATFIAGFCTTMQPVCGNGIVEGGETCDDGFTDACGTCNATCDGAGGGSICGDNLICPETETCDDGGTTPGDGCDASCQIEGPPEVPALSRWRLAAMTLLLGVAGWVRLRWKTGVDRIAA